MSRFGTRWPGLSIGGGGGGGGGAPATLIGGNALVLISDTPSAEYGTSGLRYIPLAAGVSSSVEAQFAALKDGTATVTVLYAMSVDNGGDVDFDVQALAVGAGENPNGALPAATTHSFTPGSGGATVLKTTSFTISVTTGDMVNLKITRPDDDSHTGDCRILAVYA